MFNHKVYLVNEIVHTVRVMFLAITYYGTNFP